MSFLQRWRRRRLRARVSRDISPWEGTGADPIALLRAITEEDGKAGLDESLDK